MDLDRIGMAKELWQILRKILRDGELMKHDSELSKTANLFEDELYTPPKQINEQSDSPAAPIQQFKAEIAKWVQTYPEDISKCDPDDGGYERYYKDLLYDIKRATSAVE